MKIEEWIEEIRKNGISWVCDQDIDRLCALASLAVEARDWVAFDEEEEREWHRRIAAAIGEVEDEQ